MTYPFHSVKFKEGHHQIIVRIFNEKLEGLMLKLKLQYFGHLMWRVDSLENTLMLGGIGSRRKRGRQKMRWLDGITDLLDVSFSELRILVMDREAWRAVIHGVAKSRTWLSDFTFTFHFHALEREIATHSSVLAWRIPGMGEHCGLPSMGSHSRTRLTWLSSSSSSILLKPQLLKLANDNFLRRENKTYMSDVDMICVYDKNKHIVLRQWISKIQ